MTSRTCHGAVVSALATAPFLAPLLTGQEVLVSCTVDVRRNMIALAALARKVQAAEVNLVAQSGLPSNVPVAQTKLPRPIRRGWQYDAVEVLTEEAYWFYETVGMLANVEREGRLLKGQVLDIHGPRPFEANMDEWTNPWAKTRGEVVALRRLIVTLDLHVGPDEQGRRLHDRIKGITGETFETANLWKGWLEENEAYLYWSDDADGLRIDKQAKEAGVPVEKYRSSPEGHAGAPKDETNVLLRGAGRAGIPFLAHWERRAPPLDR